MLAGLLYEYWRSGRLPSLVAPADAVGAVPVVSILIPARNEERGIARCVEGALRQRYPSYEVIVVDDGSTDATPAILARYAAHHPHLRVLHGEALPEGWTGKAFACQRAAAVARGEWLLFLDADTAAAPELLAALLTHVQQQRLDLLSVFPFLELDTFWEQAILPAFRTMIRATFPFQQANAPAAQPGAVFANGQCLLVRRSTYNAIGGHGAVRGDVLEDVLLAQRLRAAGAAVGVAMADQYIRVRMYTNGREVLEGLTKNAVAGFSEWRQTFAAGRKLSIPAGAWPLLAGAVGLVADAVGRTTSMDRATSGRYHAGRRTRLLGTDAPSTIPTPCSIWPPMAHWDGVLWSYSLTQCMVCNKRARCYLERTNICRNIISCGIITSRLHERRPPHPKRLPQWVGRCTRWQR
ncbi:MAG: glycosyltransferase [Chloroflexaceae bacterium]|nr:glycosyltransferase [Chloroflexaceae bacterium]